MTMAFASNGVKIVITRFRKARGSLTKRIHLRPDGSISNDSSQCKMAVGTAERVTITSAVELAALISNIASNEAIGLGTFPANLPARVDIVKKEKLDPSKPTTIARSRDFFAFEKGAPGFLPIDIDVKGISSEAEVKLAAIGGHPFNALRQAIQGFDNCALVWRASTSSDLVDASRTPPEPIKGSGGYHLYLGVTDASEIPALTERLARRLVVLGFGWSIVDARGALLERGLIDTAVATPEHLFFEGRPDVVPPLQQGPRLPSAREGPLLEPAVACPESADDERLEKEFRNRERTRLKPEMERARATWCEMRAKELAAKGVPDKEAREQVERMLDTRELTGGFILYFDDSAIGTVTVADVLANPKKFNGQTLADPFEGPDYGQGCAQFYANESGSLIIHSFAHGLNTVYRLVGSASGGSSAQGTSATASRPQITIRPGETERIVRQVEALIAASDRGVYRRGPDIVSVGLMKGKTWDGKDVTVQIIEERGKFALNEDMQAVADFYKINKRGKPYRANPTDALVGTLRDYKSRLRLPLLAGIVNCPSITATGDLLDVPGYDPTTGIIFDPLGIEFPRVPDFPTKARAEASLKHILRVIETFSFETDDDRAVAVSGIITGVARRGLPHAPLHAFDAPVRGSGKSKIVDIIAIIMTGRRAAVISQGDKPEEFYKTLASALLSGDPLIPIDNCDRALEGALINMALTQESVTIRIFGTLATKTVQIKAFQTANGNNLVIANDLTRRVVMGRMNPKCERPELLHFEFDPIAYALENRPRLVCDCLTILRAYSTIGRSETPPPADRLGNFELWSDTVRAALRWLGCGDPVRTQDRLHREDTTMTKMIAVFTAWNKEFGDARVTASEAIERAEEHTFIETPINGPPAPAGQFGPRPVRERQYTHPTLRNALMSVGKKGGQLDATALGNWLGSVKGRVAAIIDIDGFEASVAMNPAGKAHGGVSAWTLTTVK